MYGKLRQAILAIFIVLILICAGMYAALHSPYVLKNFVLPHLGDQVGTPISVSDISFSPFSRLETKGLSVGLTDSPAITAKEASLKYDLWAILTGEPIKLREIRLRDAQATIFHDIDAGLTFLTTPLKKAKPNSIKLDGDIDLLLSSDGTHFTASGDILIKEINAANLLGIGSDLKSTKVKFNIIYDPEKVQIKNLELNVLDDSGPYAELSGSGDIELPLGEKKSILTLSSKFVDVDRLIALFDTQSTEKVESPSKDTEYCEGVNLDSLWLDLVLTVDELKYAPLQITAIDSIISSRKGKIKIQKLDWKQGKVPAHFEGDVDFSNLDCKFSYVLKFEPAPFNHFLSALNQNDTGIEKGTLEKAIIKGAGKGFSEEQLKENLYGELDLDVRNAVLPSKFQEVPPFNIVFLPFKIVMDIGGTLASIALPSELTSLGSHARDVLDESGRLYLNQASFKLKASKGTVTIEKGEIDTNLLPTVGFDGDVYYDSSLDLTTTLHILAVQVRIPIGGTLELPLPDLVELGPQLIKGLGLTLLDPLSSLIEGEDVETQADDDDSVSDSVSEQSQK